MKKSFSYTLFLVCALTAPAQLQTMSTKSPKKPLSTQEVELAFIDHFKKAEFKQVPSVPLVRKNGELVTSGVAPFEEFLLGRKPLNGDLLFSVQPCIRAHGTQNDAARVSSSDQHLSYFESLCFLAPELFLETIIDLVHSFLTKALRIQKERLFVTVHEDDQKAYDFWKKHVPYDHILRMPRETNYWQDERHPQIHGYSTEIFIDNRPLLEQGKTPPTKKDFQQGKMLEITNIVSSNPLPQPPVNSIPQAPVGMLFKGGSPARFAAAQPNALPVFENDQIAPITKKVETLTGIKYATADQKTKAAIRKMVDNTRTATVLLSAGVKPSDQTEAGATLRTLIPQAVAAEKTLTRKPILAEVAKAATKTMAPTHPQIKKNQTTIVQTIKTESAKARKAFLAQQ